MMTVRDSIALFIIGYLGVMMLGCATETQLPPSEAKLIFEMVTDASVSVSPPGKSLDLRVYDDGRVEFDSYALGKPSKNEPAIPRLKRTKINGEQLGALEEAIKKLDSTNVETNYLPRERPFDARIVTTITYKSVAGFRKITLTENDSHLHLDSKSDIYPKALIELLNLSYKIAAAVRNQAGRE